MTKNFGPVLENLRSHCITWLRLVGFKPRTAWMNTLAYSTPQDSSTPLPVTWTRCEWLTSTRKVGIVRDTSATPATLWGSPSRTAISFDRKLYVTCWCSVATRSNHKIVDCPVREVNKPRLALTSRTAAQSCWPRPSRWTHRDNPSGTASLATRQVSFFNYSKAVSTSTRLQVVSNADITSILWLLGNSTTRQTYRRLISSLRPGFVWSHFADWLTRVGEHVSRRYLRNECRGSVPSQRTSNKRLSEKHPAIV